MILYHFSAIASIGDSSFTVNRWAEDIRTDTMIAFQGDTSYPINASDSARNFGERLVVESVHYVPVSDTLPMDVSRFTKLYRNSGQQLQWIYQVI